MNPGVVVDGVVRPDGTLELSGRLSLPAGPVRVTVEPAPQPETAAPFLQRMQAIWDARREAGLAPRGEEHVEAEREAVRSGWEERSVRMERGRLAAPEGGEGTTS